jgi:hypothetical protein
VLGSPMVESQPSQQRRGIAVVLGSHSRHGEAMALEEVVSLVVARPTVDAAVLCTV